jgi:hypothetical protein
VTQAERLHGLFSDAQESRRRLCRVLEEESWTGLVEFEKELYGRLKDEKTGLILLASLDLYDCEAKVRMMAQDLQPMLKSSSKIAARIADRVEQ